MDRFSIVHWFVAGILLLILGLLPAWRIVSKAGFPGLLSLLLLVPIVNIAMLWIFAFAPWPALRRTEQQQP